MSTVADAPPGRVTEVLPAEQTAETPVQPGPQPPGVPAPPPTPEIEGPVPIVRPAIAAVLVTFGAAFLVGGMFDGIAPRVYAAFGGIVGVSAAVWAARATKRATLIQVASLVVVAVAGIIALFNFSAINHLPDLVGQAVKSGRLRRPPAPFEIGWKPVIVWTMGMVGYAVAWVGTAMRRGAIGILIPLPIIGFTAIAQPPEDEVAGGVVALLSFVIALVVIHRADRSEGGGLPTAFEVKRALRAAPLVAGLTAVVLLLSQTNLLFPKPLYDPAQRAQLPKAVPLSKVNDRALFTVRSSFSGPWRTGVLDVYDGNAWRLPPYSASAFKPVPADGILRPDLEPNQRAQFQIKGLDGTVLPFPALAQAVVFRAAKNALVQDERTGTLRVRVGQVKKDFQYSVALALPPDATKIPAAPPVPDELKEYLDVPPAPAAVQRLLAKAPPEAFARMQFIRNAILDNVTAKGEGLPRPVPPSKVEDLLEGSKAGSPFEIVAAQALLARWAGIPARIGYGFDGGEVIEEGTAQPERGQSVALNENGPVEELREIRPRNGSSWMEVNFGGIGWIPVIGLPKKAKKTLASSNVSVQAGVLPSDEIAVQIFVPLRLEPSGLLFHRIKVVLGTALPILAVLALIWLLWPVVYKARRRAQRRAWAARTGARERIAVAYAEFRDSCTDLGVGDEHATPLAFLDFVVADQEHTELAWLVTRCLWGDLRDSVGHDEVFAAEELSRSMRRRVYEAQPVTIRFVSLVSRLSLRRPYAPELLSPPVRDRRRRRRKEEALAAA